MKHPPTKEDRLWRLKLRLGWRPRRFHIRIRPGGWIKVPTMLGVEAGHLWALESIGKTLVLHRLEPGEQRRCKLHSWKPYRNFAAALVQMPDVGTDDNFARRVADIKNQNKAGLT